MNSNQKSYFYLRSLNNSMEPMTWPRIKESGFELNVRREDIPYFISLFSGLGKYYDEKASKTPEPYQQYIQEVSSFFHKEIWELTQCTNVRTEAEFYMIPFNDFIASFILADRAFEQLAQGAESTSHYHNNLITYYKHFHREVDVEKSQFILDHLPELSSQL